MAVGAISFACDGRAVEVAEADQGAVLTAGTQMIELRRTRTSDFGFAAQLTDATVTVDGITVVDRGKLVTPAR